MKKGFTLVELLVVIVVIAVLTAFGLPMYRASVENALVNEMIKNVNIVMGSEKEFRSKNNVYTYNPQMLGVELKFKGITDSLESTFLNFNEYSLSIAGLKTKGSIDTNKRLAEQISVYASPLNFNYQIRIFADQPHNILCLAKNDDGKKICESLSGTTITTSTGPVSAANYNIIKADNDVKTSTIYLLP